ncbi:hypothetical protein LB456_12960 [Psychroflexus sp. CAK57W]|nr:hypothetical protein [Psychroflexus curvus]MBZ9628335.1 hypothetical protein [Psychroflexus curvus]MBZ9788373.1 hypothetical protein [Psychroflexus curvus]
MLVVFAFDSMAAIDSMVSMVAMVSMVSMVAMDKVNFCVLYLVSKI